LKQEDTNKIIEVLSKSKVLIKEIEEKIGAHVIVFICHQSITHRVSYRLNKVFRRLPKDTEHICMIIDSGGGDIDAASKIVKLVRSCCKKYTALVPYYAKSAATLLALGADEIIMCRSGELGVTDQIVRDPVTGLYVPASSIREAINFIQGIEDPLIKLSMAEKMPPLLIGAYNGARKVSKQYLEEIFKEYKNRDELIEVFTERYISHGYPLTREYCKDLGLPVIYPDDDLEDKVYTLYECYIDLLDELEDKEEDQKKKGEHLIIQTKDTEYVVVNDEEVNLSLQQKTTSKTAYTAEGNESKLK